MKAREYNVRIEVWETSTIPDDFGGSVTTSERIALSWALLQTESLGKKAYNFGLQQFNDPLLFLVRGRKDLPYNGRNLFLMYRGEKYIIQGIKNEGMRDIDTEIFCTKEDPETVPIIGIIPE